MEESSSVEQSIYARKTAPTARTRPPRETMLAAAAPVASGTLAEEVPLALSAVEEGLLPEPVPEAEGEAELAAGTVVLPAGTAEVTRLVATTGTELTAAGTDEGATMMKLVYKS